MTQQAQLNDAGTSFNVTIVNEVGGIVDVSQASVLEIVFKKPDGTVLRNAAVLTTDGTDGGIQYVSVGGELNVQGFWNIQGRVVLPTGDWHSSIDAFEVIANL